MPPPARRPPNRRLTFILALVSALAGPASRAADPLDSRPENWPGGSHPAAVGRRVAENFLPRRFRYQTNPAKAHLGVIYPEACAWYGALTLARLAGDSGLSSRLVAKFEPLLGDEGSAHVNRSAHVDYRVFGIVPLEIFLANGDRRCLELGVELADAQWRQPTPDGVTGEARYWIDDMYMIPAIQAQAHRATGRTVYLDRAALAMAAYLDRLQQPNGLFHHGPDSPFFWGRGNGWVAAGMAELLRDLPADHPLRGRIADGYRRMMTALLEYQAADGMWRQLVDDPESWQESSATAMFAFAMVTGVKNGWLEQTTYAPAARRAWLALVRRIDAGGNVRDVCVGTDKGSDRGYYLARPRAVGDLHGQAPVMWTASALLRRPAGPQTMLPPPAGSDP